MTAFLILATALTVQTNGVSLVVSSDTDTVDPGRSVFLTVTASAPAGTDVAIPDIGGRLRGFSVSDRINAGTTTAKDGRKTLSAEWKLVPDPVSDRYGLKPFVVSAMRGTADLSFVAGPLDFDPPTARPRVEGSIEVNPLKDAPPFSWRRVWKWIKGHWTIFAWAFASLIVAVLLALAVRYAVRRVKEHLMSPIERAWLELDRLVSRALPSHGRYKDFYVELTLVVRRYIQRKYGVRAPHLTTEEFLREVGLGGSGRGGCPQPSAGSGGSEGAKPRTTNHQPPTTKEGSGRRFERLKEFLESADLVKFAGVEATGEMASEATESARTYLKEDSGT